MRERNQRHGDACHAADLGGEHAAGVDHQLGGDVATVGDHAADPSVADLDARDTRVLADLRSPPPRAFDQRICELAGIDVAVGRQECRAQHAIGRHRRKHALGLLGGDQLERQPESLGPRRLARELFHPLLARG